MFGQNALGGGPAGSGEAAAGKVRACRQIEVAVSFQQSPLGLVSRQLNERRIPLGHDLLIVFFAVERFFESVMP